MPTPRSLTRFVAVVCMLVGLTFTTERLAAQPAPQKKVLTHADQDMWRSAASVNISADGRYVAWYEVPGEGDSEFAARSVTNGTIWRHPTTMRATAAPPGGRAAPPKSWCQFHPASARIAFLIGPAKPESNQPAGPPRQPLEAILGVMDLATGKVESLGGVQGFDFTAGGSLVYHKSTTSGKVDSEPTPPATKQPGGKGSVPAPRATPTFGSELVLRDGATGAERKFADVSAYTLSKDGKSLVFTVASRKDETNGIYMIDPTTTAPPVAIKSGPGRYTRMAWDEKQTLLAFLYDSAGVLGANEIPPPRPAGTPIGAPAPPSLPRLHVYVWDRATKPTGKAANLPLGPGGPAGGFAGIVTAGVAGTAMLSTPATEVVGPVTPGLPAGWAVADVAPSFDSTGSKVFLQTAPVRKPTAPTATPAADKVDLDIWHWKDARIQPMQKIEADADRRRSYAAVYILDNKQFRQLSDETITVTPPIAGDWAIGVDDRKYRHLTGYVMPVPGDYSLINVRTGQRTPTLTAFAGPTSSSPNGTHFLAFNGKDWIATAIPDGRKVNLTAALPTKFFDEDDDHPAAPPPYEAPIWSTDGKSVILADRFDLWRVPLDGSQAENLTKVGRIRQIRFRAVNLANDEDDDPRKGLDISKPVLLRAENLYTRDTGFFRLEPGSEAKMLVMGARRYSVPVKAKNADALLFSVQTFQDFPDYFTTSADFHDVKRVTEMNPMVRDYNWGRAELVRYKSTDGQPLSGILVKPENFDPNKKYPMVVYIYERLTDGLHQFRIPSVTRGQVINPTFYASNGYLVLMPDIVYKTGYPGQSAIKCVLPAIQAVVDLGCVDEKAIGINGQSWGGYQIAYMVTQTNRFKAAVAGAPVSNMISAYDGIRWGTGLPRQFQYELSQSRIGDTPWKAPMRYIENSPVFMADRVETPLLMIHNDQDDAVPWYQGIEYYLALRRLEKECYLFNYNGEPHNLAKKANARDFSMRMYQFFEHHLRGKPAPEWMTNGVPFLDRDAEKEQFKKLTAPVKP